MTQATTRNKRTKTKSEKAMPPAEAVAQPVRPRGKLGQLVERLEATEGATLAELTELTGWQHHTVRASLTRLRQRHFKICLESRKDRKAYRLGAGEG